VPANFAGLPAGLQAWSVTVTEGEPTRLIGGTVLPPGAPQQVRLWWWPQADPAAPALLYLHGTFRNLYQNLHKIEALRAAGFTVLAEDYRGWGSSTPITPSEDSIKADARLAWREFVQRVPQPGRRVVYGHSMGGGVAVALASELRYPEDHAALVLEATFASMPDVARRQGFWGRVGALLTTEIFDSAAVMPRLQTPLLMLHGDADRTVPYESGRALFAAATMPHKTFVTVPGGGHSTLQSDQPALYRESLQALIQRLPAAGPAPR
jgi:alpha-beta hydrolase superfamily lysophospholipase